jgi:hypothetical protein
MPFGSALWRRRGRWPDIVDDVNAEYLQGFAAIT